MCASEALHRFSLAGKVALITGSGGGIGRVLAASWARPGRGSPLHDRTEDQLIEARQLLEKEKLDFDVFTADLADVSACRSLVDEVAARMGHLDILVNCAAANRREPVDHVSPETFDWLVSVNVRAPFFLSQWARRVMRAQGGGKIINVASINAYYALDTCGGLRLDQRCDSADDSRDGC